MTNPRPRAGRPTSLDYPIDVPVASGGTRRTTVEARIIELMGTGAHVDTAAASLGILRETLHDWLRIGGRTRTAIASGRLGHPDDLDAEQPPPDTHSLRCMEFSIAVDAAQADWLMRQEATLEAAVRPGERRIVTTTVDSNGDTTTSTRVEKTGPDMPTLRWRLERHPASRDTYGKTTTAVELSGPDGEAIPVEMRVSSISEKIAALRAQRAEQPSPEPEGEPDGDT